MSGYDQLMEVIRQRRSVRQFSERAIERDDLVRLLEAARWAPSNHNRQPWRFLAIQDKKHLQQLAEAVRQGLTEKLKSLPESAASYTGEFGHYATFFEQAPMLLLVLHKQRVCVARPLLAGLRNPELVSGEALSAAMAVQNLLLAAQTLGLGTCMLTGPLLVEDALIGALNLPAGYEFTCLVALGYPAESPAAPRRKSVEQILEYRDNLRTTKI